MKNFKKIPITIRAAIIGSVIGAVITGLFLCSNTMCQFVIEDKIMNKRKNDFASIHKLLDYHENDSTDFSTATIFKWIDYNKDDGTGFTSFKKYLQVNDGIHIKKSGYIDLVGDGNFDEYFILYKDTTDYNNTYEYFYYIVLTSKRSNNYEILFYEKFDGIGLILDIIFFTRDSKPQVMIYTIQGQGNFLDFSIYEYDKFSKLSLLYYSGDYERGRYHFINNKMLISASSRQYVVEYDNGYYISEYNYVISIPDNFSATKIINFSNESGVKIFINKTEIKFRENERGGFETIKPIEIRQNDMLLLNTNIQIGEPFTIRMLTNNKDPIIFIPGFYGKMIYKEKGLYSINLICDGVWYELYVNVK